MKAAYETGASALYKDDDIQALIEKLEMQNKGTLFADIVELGVNAGLRISDLLSLRMYDERIDLKKGLLSLIEQKTGKKQVVAFEPTTLRRIVTKRSTAYPEHDYLFQSSSNRAAAKRQPISVRSVNRAITEAAKSLKLDGQFSSHSLRKGFATRLLEQGVGIEIISQLLNHSSITTTQKYLQLGAKRMIDARRMVAFSRAA